MTEFDPATYVDIGERNGKEYRTIDPFVFYPAVIERIEYVLRENVFPSEIVQQRMVDGDLQISTSRSITLLNNAKSLPAEAWVDALAHRKTFTSPVGYIPPKKRPDLAIYTAEVREDILRVWNRGDALEVAQGWFLHALRCRIGGANGRILTGALEGETPADFYHYQL